MAMEIKPGRMVYLGFGKYWRSDEIVGLTPIEEGRGPGRRTEVYVHGRDDAMVASRTERTILQDMVTAPEEIVRMEEARALATDLVDAFSEMSPLLRRVLATEGRFDVDRWEERLAAFLTPQPDDDRGAGPSPQTDIFT
jgi:hypothetical protein